MILFAHTKFGLVRIQGSRVKGGGRNPPPRSERVFHSKAYAILRNHEIEKSVTRILVSRNFNIINWSVFFSVWEICYSCELLFASCELPVMHIASCE